MIQELELTHRHHMARPSPGIPLQIKICLHSFVFFCDDIGSLTFNRGRNTTSDEVQTQTQWQPRKNIGCTRVCCDSVLCCIFHSFAPPPWCVVCIVYVGPKCAAQARRSLVPGPAQASAGDGAGLSLGADTGAETPTVTRGKWTECRGDTETRENIINSDICGKNSREYCRVWQWPAEDHIISSEKSREPGSVYRWSARVW